MAGQVKFYRGAEAIYKPNWNTKYKDGIFFATDRKLIYLNNIAYGVDPDTESKLNKAIDTVTWSTETENTLVFTSIDDTLDFLISFPTATTAKDGFMSAGDKSTLDKLNGADTVDGSVLNVKSTLLGTTSDTKDAETIRGVKNYADNINDSVSAIETALGLTGDGSTITPVETQINNKIKLLDYTDTESSSNKYVSLVNEVDGIISVKHANLVASNNQILSTNPSGELAATLDLVYDSAAKTITLTGKDDGTGKNFVIGTVRTDDFVKDGMLKDTEIVTLPEEGKDLPSGVTEAGTYIKFTWNTDSTPDNSEKVDYLNVTNLIDVYTAGNGLVLNGKLFSAKIDDLSESFLTVGTNGLKLSGILEAINNAKDDAKAAASKVTLKAGTTHITLAKPTTDANGLTTYTIGENDIASASTLSTVSGYVDTLRGDKTTEGSLAKVKDTIDNYTINGNKLSSSPIVLDGSNLVLTGYTSETGNSVVASDTINSAIKKLDDALLWYDEL